MKKDKKCKFSEHRARGRVLEWKPVQLTGEFIGKGVEGLVGIEELSDYSLVSGSNQQNKKAKLKEIDKKRKHEIKSQTKKRKNQDSSENLITMKKDTSEPLIKKLNPSKNLITKKKYTAITNETLSKKKKVHFVESKYVVDTESSKKENEESETDVSSEEGDIGGLQDDMAAWCGLSIPGSILRTLAEQGFKEPTVIQRRTLPSAIMGRRDILGAAETGSGKTLAFGIPILCHILEDKLKERHNEGESENEYIDADSDGEEEEELVENVMDLGCVQVINNVSVSLQNTKGNSKLYALILTPTRELAIQIKNHLKTAAKYTGIKIAVVVGGMSIQKQERLLNRGPEIVVATPGRLWEMIQNGNEHLAQVGSIRYLAVDETDRMLEKGHFQELQNLLELLNVNEGCKKKRQNFVFSATLTMVHDPPRHLKGQKKKLKITPGQKLQSIMTALGITNPKVIDITNDSGMAGTLTEARIMCTLKEKDFYLYYFLQRHPGRTLIFCNSISCVRRLAQLLTILNCNPLPLHANMVQRQRLKNLDRFRENSHGVLLATDVAARGLDIPNVQHVVHYQVPRTSESYVHRSGRTARAQKQGLTLLLIEPTEAHYYAQLCRTLGRSKDLPLFPIANNALNVAKKRVVLAREVDQLELASRRSTSETGWFRKALSDMDMLVDEDDVPRQLDEDECSRNRKVAALKKKQLAVLLSKPMFISNSETSQLNFDNSVSSDKKKGKRRKKNKE